MTRHRKKTSDKTAAPAAVETIHVTSIAKAESMGDRCLLATSQGLIFIHGEGLMLESFASDPTCWKLRDKTGRTVITLADWDGNPPLSLESPILE